LATVFGIVGIVVDQRKWLAITCTAVAAVGFLLTFVVPIIVILCRSALTAAGGS